MPKVIDPELWPHDKMWWCWCIANDCRAVAIGPFQLREMAEAEANMGCDHKHVASQGVPELDTLIMIGIGDEWSYYLDSLPEDVGRQYYKQARQWDRWYNMHNDVTGVQERKAALDTHRAGMYYAEGFEDAWLK